MGPQVKDLSIYIIPQTVNISVLSSISTVRREAAKQKPYCDLLGLIEALHRTLASGNMLSDATVMVTYHRILLPEFCTNV